MLKKTILAQRTFLELHLTGNVWGKYLKKWITHLLKKISLQIAVVYEMGYFHIVVKIKLVNHGIW